MHFAAGPAYFDATILMTAIFRQVLERRWQGTFGCLLLMAAGGCGGRAGADRGSTGSACPLEPLTAPSIAPGVRYIADGVASSASFAGGALMDAEQLTVAAHMEPGGEWSYLALSLSEVPSSAGTYDCTLRLGSEQVVEGPCRVTFNDAPALASGTLSGTFAAEIRNAPAPEAVFCVEAGEFSLPFNEACPGFGYVPYLDNDPACEACPPSGTGQCPDGQPTCTYQATSWSAVCSCSGDTWACAL